MISNELNEIVYNVNDENIAKLGVMLANADMQLFEAEKNKAIGAGTNIDSKAIANFSLNMNPEEMKQYIEKAQAVQKEKVKELDIKIMDAKSIYRSIAIVFDTVKLIVENRNANKN
jgi:hypothetical protein